MTILKKNQVAVDKTEHDALCYLRDHTHEKMLGAKERLAMSVIELTEINNRQRNLLNNIILEISHLRTKNEVLVKTCDALNASCDAAATAKRIADLELMVKEQNARLKQAEGTQLFHNNQRLEAENASLRKQLKAAGPISITVLQPETAIAVNGSSNGMRK